MAVIVLVFLMPILNAVLLCLFLRLTKISVGSTISIHVQGADREGRCILRCVAV